jgi:hypothetical protein
MRTMSPRRPTLSHVRGAMIVAMISAPIRISSPSNIPPPEIGAIALIGIALSGREQIPDVSGRRHGHADQDYADPEKFEPGCKRLQHGSDQVGETARFTTNVHLSILSNKTEKS